MLNVSPLNNQYANKLAVLILAAGKSSRLGQAKQLINYQHQPLIRHQIDKGLSVSSDVYCVLGHQADVMVESISNCKVKIVINENWQEGMSSSIAEGVKALSDDIDAVMILLVDQWQVSSSELKLLKDKFITNCRQGTLESIIVASKPSQQGKSIGPPVIFPCCYFSQLSQLTGHQGAKPLLIQYKEHIEHVELASAFVDLDTPEDLAVLKVADLNVNN